MGALNRAILNLERQLRDEWQQAPSLDLLPLGLGPVSPRVWSPGLAKEDHCPSLRAGQYTAGVFLWLSLLFR